MAARFENVDVVLSKERAKHINERHVTPTSTRTSVFYKNFNLTTTLAYLTKKNVEYW